jgi:hypothetical protein
MSEPHPRKKFWVTDPPATFDDEEAGVIILMVFTSRAKLRAYYRAVEGLPTPKRSTMQQRRFGQLRKDITMLGWQGIAVDPDPEGGKSRILRYDTGVPMAVPRDAIDAELEDMADALLERPAHMPPDLLRRRRRSRATGPSDPKPEITTGKPDEVVDVKSKVVGSD